MQNLVGSIIPSEAEVAKLLKEIEGVTKKVQSFAIHLTPAQRKGLLKMRPDGAKIVTLVGRLCAKYGVASGDTPVDGMNADLLLSERIRPLTAAAGLLAQTLDDTELEAEGECWHAATANYSMLVVLARNNAQLASELAPARDFFATGRRAAKVAPAT